MGDFITLASENQFFDRIEKSEVSKVKTDLTTFDGGVFSIKCHTRGKEMILDLIPLAGEISGVEKKTLAVTMGMSGGWIWIRHDSPKKEDALKHSHLRLYTTRGDIIALHDVRRFAKWRWGSWGANRGPCPLTEFNQFGEKIRAIIGTAKAFRVPLNELLMNQSYFNGVGNYLRAEILNRLPFSPFTIATDLEKSEMDQLIRMVHLCCRDAYSLGGGQLKDWKNPYGTEGANFEEWMTVYSKGSSLIDRTGRRFWYHPRWERTVPDFYRDKNPSAN